MNIFDYLRMALYAALIAVLVLMYQLWDKEHLKPMVKYTTETTGTNYIPEIKTDAIKATDSAPTSPSVINTGNLIHVKTDVIEADIDSQGGNIIQVKLIKYPEKLHSSTPFILLNNSSQTRYIAQSGLLSDLGPDTSQGQATYTTEKPDYVLNQGQAELTVNLHWQNQDGLKINKIFTFKPNDYQINVRYLIDNQSKKPWEGSLYLQLLRKNNPPEQSQGFSNLTTYFGAAISSSEKPFQKINFKEMDQQSLDKTITGGWAAMVQHYFVSAWVPETNITSKYFSRVTPDGLYTIGMIEPKVIVPIGGTSELSAKLYAGPAIADLLEKTAPGLPLTIDYGWFWFLSVIIFWMMQKVYYFVGNWGWSIVIVTMIIKLIFYPLSSKSYRSMSALKKVQPKINALKERFGDDKQKFTQATLELYKKEKVNPMSGCLPILIQIPVFIALYWVLIESVYLRQAPFILWIQDLSTKDPYYVLPILMGLSMLVQQRLSPPPPDPMQAKVMMFMPVLFTALFINFPAGLMLYWFVNNTLSVLQQWFIMRSMEKTENTNPLKKT